MSPRYRRLAAYLLSSLIVYALYTFWPASSGEPMIASASTEDVETAELRLARLRTIATTVPAKEDVLKKVDAALAQRETGLIQTETAAQAQAQLFTILRRIGSDDDIEVRQSQLPGVTDLAEGAYGLAQVAVQFDCRIEQLVNFLAALAAQPELIVTRGVQIEAADPRTKIVRVRLNAGAVVPPQLLPAKGGQR